MHQTIGQWSVGMTSDTETTFIVALQNLADKIQLFQKKFTSYEVSHEGKNILCADFACVLVGYANSLANRKLLGLKVTFV